MNRGEFRESESAARATTRLMVLFTDLGGVEGLFGLARPKGEPKRPP